MSVREEIVAILRERFPDVAFDFDHADEVIATLAAPHSALGTLSIEEDGNEATVGIGEISHSHFGPSSRRHPDAREVAEQVAEFLDDFFNGRIYVWVGRAAGGSRRVKRRSLKRRPGVRKYLWSGPVE